MSAASTMPKMPAPAEDTTAGLKGKDIMTERQADSNTSHAVSNMGQVHVAKKKQNYDGAEKGLYVVAGWQALSCFKHLMLTSAVKHMHTSCIMVAHDVSNSL